MPFDIRPTGVAGLDTVLGGGLPRGTVLMIAGAPGSGKTVLAQQLCFGWARSAREGAGIAPRALYFSVLSEPHDKLIAHIESFAFFDPEELGRDVKFLSLRALLDEGLDATATAVVRQARQDAAGLVVIDGFRALETWSQSRADLQNFLYKLSTQLGMLGATLVIAVDRDPNDSASFGEFTTADAVLGLYNRIAGAQQRRYLEVRKLRGRAPLGGLHTCRITQEGLEVYPRLESRIPFEDEGTRRPAGAERVLLDLPELDRMLGGGLPAGSATLLAGSPGTGKTLLGLYYLAAGLRRGEPGLFVGLAEDRTELLARGRALHLDLDAALDSGLLTLHTLSPVEIEPDRVSDLIRREVERGAVRRLVLDSAEKLEQAARAEGRAAGYLAALHAYLRARGVTAVLADAIPVASTPTIDIGNLPLPNLCDNLIVLRYVTYQAALYRILTVVKVRGSDHDHTIREYTIDSAHGLIIREQGESVAGVLSGIADEVSRPGRVGGPAGPRRARG